MRKYEVHIPKDELELKELEGKVVKFFDNRSVHLSKDRLVFKLNPNNVEFIFQGETISSPSYPDYSIRSQNVKLRDLHFNFCGLYFQFDFSHFTYRSTEIEYNSRKEALEKEGLWVEPFK